MKKLVAVATVALWLPCLAIAQAQTPNPSANAKVEQELLKLERSWVNALVKRDVDALNRILADDHIGTDGDGNAETKQQSIESVRSGEYVLYSSDEVEPMKARVYGDTAVVTGCDIARDKVKGKESTYHYRFTDTWVKRGGRWQCVAWHGSKVAATPTADAKAEQEILKLEAELQEAFLKRDVNRLKQLLSDDHIGTGSDGEVWTKDEGIAALASGEYVLLSLVREQPPKIRVYGDTALATGTEIGKEKYKGKERSFHGRYTAAWVKRNNQWQCAGWHGSNITDK